MEQKEYTCIVCPQSCQGTLTALDDGSFRTEGFTCPNGEKYAINEYQDPKRVLTTTVIIDNAPFRLLPVVSTDEISRTIFGDCLRILYQVRAQAPVKAGDVILKDIMGTGTDIVAARTMDAI